MRREKGQEDVLLCSCDIVKNLRFATQFLGVGFIDREWAFGKLDLDEVD
jgi:hypothetical protein